MKKITILNLLLSVLLVACSLFENDSKISNKYTNNKHLKAIRKLEKKPNKNETDYTKLVINYYDLAIESNDIDITNLAVKQIKKIRNNHFDNPTITGYYGSANILIGRDHPNQNTKIITTKKGIILLDKALEKDSKNIFLRILRAELSLKLPPFFKRINFAIKDYKYIADCYENKKCKFRKPQMSLFYLHQGEAFKKNKNLKKAVIAWKKTVKINPGSKNAEHAQKELEIYDES